MFPIFAIETAVLSSSLAIAVSEDEVAEISFPCDIMPASGILPFFSELLEKSSLTPNDIETVVVDVGPGSFTGIRVGLAFAKGFCYGRGLGILPLVSLEAVAYRQGRGGEIVCVALDARQEELYFAAYLHKGVGVLPQELSPPLLIGSGELSERFFSFDESARCLVTDSSDIAESRGVRREEMRALENIGARRLAEVAALKFHNGATPQSVFEVVPFYIKNFEVTV
ncbi:MAG: hypothetical protein Kow0090_20200 [Myxococcota bacterium]